MSPRQQVQSLKSLSARTQPSRALQSPVSRLALYLCCAAELIFSFGGAVGSMPWTRLVESVICRRHVGGTVAESGILYQTLLSILLMGGKGGPTAEAQCKGDMVQAEMAEL